tara:strand:- start:20 stop:403 length:384 start_codon:yes stop_codon:yes gene_type:complete
MFKGKIIIKTSISILMLVIYLFSSLSILSSHNHDHDNHHDNHHDLPICKNIDGNSFNTSDCSHESHIVSSKEICTICDYFSNCETEKLDISIITCLDSFTLKKIQSFASLYLIDATSTQNKSPPFII